jgi:cytochrome b pre-mRNA-processing protein 3
MPGNAIDSVGCRLYLPSRRGAMTALLKSWQRRRERRSAVFEAYRRIVERAREPLLFARWGLPDTLDGRFEMLVLHVFLVLHRLKREGEAAAAFAQALFDWMFADLDGALREMGASDLGVGPRIKAMARGFYGRVAAYEKGLEDEAALAAALGRNLFGTLSAAAEAPHLEAARYVRQQAAALAEVPAERLLAGEVPFAPLALARKKG